MIYRISILFISVICTISCTQSQSFRKSGEVMFTCVRDNDTIHLKITNNTDDTLYIPPTYLGTYNSNSDTIFLEMVDKPRFNKNNFYLYKKLFPFEVYLTSQIAGENPDSIITVTSQTYYFNQFNVRPFAVILPHSSHITTTSFYVPQGSDIAHAVYYKKPFFSENKEKPGSHLLDDWIKFDSVNAKYLTCEIINRAYPN